MRFDTICEANGIGHRLTKPNHPWSCEDRKTIRGESFSRATGRSSGSLSRGLQANRCPLPDRRDCTPRRGQWNRTIKDGEAQSRSGGSPTADRQPLPLQGPRPAPHPPGGLHGSLQLRAKAQDPRRPHALRIHLQDLDIRAGQIHPKSDPPDAGIHQMPGLNTWGPLSRLWPGHRQSRSRCPRSASPAVRSAAHGVRRHGDPAPGGAWGFEAEDAGSCPRTLKQWRGSASVLPLQQTHASAAARAARRPVISNAV